MIWTSVLSETPGVPSGIFPLHAYRAQNLRAIHVGTTMTGASPSPSAPTRRGAASLGAASASDRWRWADGPVPTALTAPTFASPTPQVAAVRLPPLLLEAMRAAAHAHGRSLNDVWAEAAREWLSQHLHEDEPQPPTPAAAALALPRPTRSWAGIDAVLGELRRSPDTAA
jgi:hypothetical protein